MFDEVSAVCPAASSEPVLVSKAAALSSGSEAACRESSFMPKSFGCGGRSFQTCSCRSCAHAPKSARSCSVGASLCRAAGSGTVCAGTLFVSVTSPVSVSTWYPCSCSSAIARSASSCSRCCCRLRAPDIMPSMISPARSGSCTRVRFRSGRWGCGVGCKSAGIWCWNYPWSKYSIKSSASICRRALSIPATPPEWINSIAGLP